LDDLQHPDCRACEERKRLSLGQLTENRHLREALAEDRENWSFETLLTVGDALLAEVYPTTIFIPSDCVDAEPGPALVRAVRACREAMKSESGEES